MLQLVAIVFVGGHRAPVVNRFEQVFVLLVQDWCYGNFVAVLVLSITHLPALGFAAGVVNDVDENGNNVMSKSDDGIPYACHICREHFKDPVVTNCLHYFCESCIMNHVRTLSEACPICNKDTGSVFNLPTKLIAKKRKVLGRAAAQEDDSWERYFQTFRDGKEGLIVD